MSAHIASMLTPRAYARSISAITCSYVAGDVACQHIEASSWRNRRRTAEFAAVGGGLMAPMSHTLEYGLERVFPGATVRPIAQKVVARIFVAPVFLSTSFGALALLRGAGARGDCGQGAAGVEDGLALLAGDRRRHVPLRPLWLRPQRRGRRQRLSCFLSWVAFSG